MTRRRVRAPRGFSLLEAIVGIGIATALLGALALFTVNLGDARERLSRTSREIECVEAVFSAVERGCATMVVDGAELGAGIEGNESGVRIVRSAVGLGNDGRAPFSELTATTVAFDAAMARIAVTRGGSRDVLGAPVRAMRVRYLTERGWQSAFSSADDGAFPVGIEISVWFERGEGGDESVAEEAPSEAAVAADRRRFFRCMGGPKVDPMAIRSIESETVR